MSHDGTADAGDPSDLFVMYIDDEPDLCSLFVDDFAEDGITIAAFTKADVAISAALVRTPDLLFIDYRMAGANGDEIAKAMPAAVPKYLITGDVNVQTETVFVRKFEKPADFVAIRAVIAEARRAKKTPGGG